MMKYQQAELFFMYCGRKIEVKFCESGNWADGGMGRFDDKKSQILIDSNMNQDTQASTLLHEIIHLALESHDIREIHSMREMETATCTIEIALLQIFRDNPAVVDFIAQRREDEEVVV